MKRLKQHKIFRYDMGDGYIMEVEEDKDDPVCGLIWHFWITKERSGIKSAMFGWPADQTQAYIDPHVYTRAEAVELAAENFESYIEVYEAEIEAIENYEPEGVVSCKP